MERIVGVKFKSHHGYGVCKTYHYLTDIDDLQKGDTVVVESPTEGLTCVDVVAVDESEIGVQKATKWIVQKIDTTAHKARQEAVKKRAMLLAKLEKKQKEWLAQNQYTLLAQHDADAAAILEELKSLS